MKLQFAISVALLSLAIACNPRGPVADEPTSEPPAPEILDEMPVSELAAAKPTLEACALEGLSFRSIKTAEGGLGADGVVMSHYHVRFEGNVVKWTHSDVEESAVWRCHGGAVSTDNKQMNGAYDRAKKRLSWAGMEYALVE